MMFLDGDKASDCMPHQVISWPFSIRYYGKSLDLKAQDSGLIEGETCGRQCEEEETEQERGIQDSRS